MWATYVLQVITAGIAFFQLAKDWAAHKHDWRRRAVFSLIVLLMLLSLYSTHRSAKNTADQHDKDVKRGTDQHNEDLQQISALKQSVETANTNQVENTKIFVKQFGDVSKQLTDLKTQVKTEELQTRVAQLQGELRKNIKAMEPSPKAELAWTFTHEPFKDIDEPDQKDMSATPIDGIVHVEVNFINRAFADALDGDLTIFVCDFCTFATEPTGFKHLAGAPQQQRMISFNRLLARTISNIMAFDVKVPADVSTVHIGMLYRCRTCKIPNADENPLTIHIKPLRKFYLPK
jgi:hypothetical protein